MRRIFIALLLALAGAGISQAQVSPIRGWCESGAQQVVLAGLNSTTQVQASFPQCTVTVSIHGDGAATIFADANSTPLGNPFTAQTNGQWIFYVASGRYDVQLSGAGFPTPITYSDIFTTGAGGATVIPGGSPIQTQVNNNGAFGGTPCESFNNILTGPENVSCDWHSKGPNPYFDITQYGARPCNVGIAPCAAGVTASINTSSFTATISSVSTFINGDGVVIYGAGSASGLSTPAAPTVTQVLAQMGIETDLTVADSAAGSTTKCYKIIARTTLGGYTPASPETCTTTGQATLGIVTVNLSNCTRAITVVTCTTSSPHPVLVGFNGSVSGPEVYIGGTAGTIDNSFRGWRQVQSATDSTHFTFSDLNVNTGNGAPTSTSGGTATFFTANHLSWTAVTGAWLYYIYGGASGAETLIGVSRPSNIGPNALAYTTWDDFSNLMQNFTFPPWIPTTPPVSGTNNNLSTTIASGAGTTTLTLVASAGATVSNAGIRLDATPAFLATAAASQGGSPSVSPGVLYIPGGAAAGQDSTNFVINSFCDLTPYRLSIVQNGNITVHETLALKGVGLRYSGAVLSSANDPGSNTWGGYPHFNVFEAVPGLYLNEGNSLVVRGVKFQFGVVGTPIQNGVLLVLTEPGFNDYWVDDGFVTGSQSTDLAGFGLILRGQSSAAIGDTFLDRITLASGLNGDGTSHNTAFFCNNCGTTIINSMYNIRAGIIYFGNPSGESLSFHYTHYNGGFTPLVSAIMPSTSFVSFGQPGQQLTMDTVGHPCLSMFSGSPAVFLNSCGPSGYIFTSPAITGGAGAVNYGVAFGASAFPNTLGTTLLPDVSVGPSLTYNVTGPHGGISVGYNDDQIFVEGAPPAAPTCVVSAGGSVATGSYQFAVAPNWWQALAGQYGQNSSLSNVCTTTGGSQTITINWTIPPGNPQSMHVFVIGVPNSGIISGGGSPCFGGVCNQADFPVNTTSAVWSTGGIQAPVAQNFPHSGPTALLPGTQGIATPALKLAGAQFVTGVQGTDTNFFTSGTIAGGAGVSLCTDANHGATTSGCPSAGTFYQTVDSNGTAQTQRPTLNFISGANATATCVDNAGATRTDCTFAANSVTAWSSITAATNANAGTFAATGNTWDFSGATSFKIPVAGGAAPTADGTIADNSTTHGLNFGSNGNTLNVAVASTGAGGTGTTCAANSAVTALSNTAAPTCTQLTGGGLPYTNWGVNSSCAQTGSGAGATQTCTISFNNTEANTSYKIVCGGTGVITGYPFMQGVITKNTTNAVVQYTNGTSNEAVVSGWANIECILTR